jgi:hypothetical protein
MDLIWVGGEGKYFFGEDWTAQAKRVRAKMIIDLPDGQITRTY